MKFHILLHRLGFDTYTYKLYCQHLQMLLDLEHLTKHDFDVKYSVGLRY